MPFKLLPAYKDYLWGGNSLAAQFGTRANMGIIAESWELSAHPDGQSTIVTGPYAGQSFGDCIREHPGLCGPACAKNGQFPILIKFIDARDKLSIQVHPDNEYALRNENDAGKTEAWIILNCTPDAFIYHGFEHPVTKAEFRRRIENHTLEEVLHRRPVKPGDVVFIPAGTIHAIGAGILLAEVQQSSNATYRVYDYGRRDVDGNLRPLHIDKALDTTVLTPAAGDIPGARLLLATGEYVFEQLVSCPYFTVQRLSMEGRFIYSPDNRDFTALLCVEGAFVLEGENVTLYISKGDCVFVPAKSKGFLLKGAGQFLFNLPKPLTVE